MITLTFGRTFEKQIAISGNVLPAATDINRNMKTQIEEKPKKCSHAAHYESSRIFSNEYLLVF